jgi:exodeoxyribonuclease VII small subunit
MGDVDTSSYSQVNDRLKQIIAQVSDGSIALDDALDLFDEAVQLGVRASTLMEEDITSRDLAAASDEADAAHATEDVSGAEDGALS